MNSRSYSIALLAVLLASLLVFGSRGSSANSFIERGDDDADLPGRLQVDVNKADYLLRRAEQIGLRRGVYDDPIGVMRARAIDMLTQQENVRLQGRPNAPLISSWTSIGPAPIPNGSGLGGPTPTSGRTISIAIDPADPNIAYIGTAQGGLYRTLDGGTNWTNLMDNALSLAIGSLTLVPGDSTTLWVGTGESGFSADSFFGYGVYRITNVKTTPIVEGPFNKDAATGLTDLMTGRSADGLAVDPNNPDVLYVGTSSGVGGIGGDVFGNAPIRGLFKSTNATSANPTFTKLAIGPISAATDQRVMDILFEPGSSVNLVLSTVALSGTLGGVWRTVNATNAAPTFTQALSITSIPASSGLTRCELTQTKIAGVTTVYAASSENSGAATCGTNGTLRKSTDGGVTWSAPIAGGNGFCSTQCFYNIAVDVHPANANIVMLGGNIVGACTKGISRSTDSGATFANSPNVHADNHVVKFAPSNPLIVYEGNDGGIFKSIDGGVTFTSLNNTGFVATQFQSLALHPVDRQFMIGGTQDNGTEYLNPAGVWTNADGGDGGFSLIDQSGGADLENVNMYHTYFNATNVIGFARMTKASCIPTKDWVFRGACGAGGNDPTPSCDTTQEVLANGMTCGESVEFYAPMTLGPGSPNTLYYGTTRLYRSTDRGDTMPAVSQAMTSTLTAIGISPQSDSVRLVGLRNGQVFGTSTGANPLVNVTGTITARYVARTVIDPNDNVAPYTAYVTLAGFGTTATPVQHVWKTTNLADAGTTWTAMSTGLPDVPVNAFVIDPQNSNHLYAGTDIGVYVSQNAGTSWSPYGSGLPRVAVFDMAIHNVANPDRVLRVATHGRGIWEIALLSPSAASARLSGTVTTTDGSPLAGVTVRLSGPTTSTTITDSNGNYRFGGTETGSFYTVTPELANYSFSPADRSFSLVADKTDAVFTATLDAAVVANAIDTAEYFVRQQYLDFLGREPERDGFNYWSEQVNQCHGDADCIRARRIDVSAAFFMSREFQDTGSFVYRLYRGTLGRQLRYSEFSADRAQVVGGPNLEASKTTFANAFVQRTEFVQKYEANLNAASFVDALLQTMNDSAGVDLANERAALIDRYNQGGGVTESRAAVVRELIDNAAFADVVYNESFVAMEYFGYLRRNPDPQGYTFWLNVLNSGDRNNYRGMVCSFITSAEYQRRFSTAVTRNNSECAR